MYSRALRWFLVGTVLAAAVVAAGAAVAAARRGCMLADDEAAMFPPTDETLDADRVSPAGSIG
jgi:hypothetical protein